MKILIGDISSYKAIVVASFLKKNYPKSSIYSFDTRPFTSGWRTKYSDKHFVVKSNEVVELTDIITKNKIDIFLPVINESLGIFWKQKQHFGKALDYLGSFKAYELLNDKMQLSKLAVELGVKVPQRFDDLTSAEIPFVVKPTNLSSSEGVIYVHSRSQIPSLDNENELIIQEYVEGVGLGYSFYAKAGVIKEGYGHKRLAEFPVSGGSSTYRTSYEDSRMKAWAQLIVSKVEYTGFAMFEFKLSPSNELYLLEVNPRIWGSINQGMANGFNYFSQILGESKVSVVQNIKDYNTYLSPLFYISIIRYFCKFNFSVGITFFKNLFKNKADVNFLNDPKGYVSIVLRKLLK